MDKQQFIVMDSANILGIWDNAEDAADDVARINAERAKLNPEGGYYTAFVADLTQETHVNTLRWIVREMQGAIGEVESIITPATAAKALGSVKSERKARASRVNGLKGGRPRKGGRKASLHVRLTDRDRATLDRLCDALDIGAADWIALHLREDGPRLAMAEAMKLEPTVDVICRGKLAVTP